MELLDLPDECVLLVLGHLPVTGTVACGETCKRLRALVHSDTLWIPRLHQEFGLEVKVCPASNFSLIRVYLGLAVTGNITDQWNMHCSATSQSLHSLPSGCGYMVPRVALMIFGCAGAPFPQCGEPPYTRLP
jgi:hypothetical protein